MIRAHTPSTKLVTTNPIITNHAVPQAMSPDVSAVPAPSCAASFTARRASERGERGTTPSVLAEVRPSQKFSSFQSQFDESKLTE
jgi:hypothetical protein